MGEKLLTGREVAARLGLSPATIRRKAKELGAIRLNSRTTRFESATVDKFITSHKATK